MSEQKYKAALERVYNTLCGNSFNHSSKVQQGRIERALRVIDETLNPELKIKLKKTPEGYEYKGFKIVRREQYGVRDGNEVFFDVEVDGKKQVFGSLTAVKDMLREKTQKLEKPVD